MQLAYVSSNGETLDISAAILQEPLTVRGLLTEALLQCQANLPDTLDLLQAEHAIRDALLQVQGEQEKYVKSYTLARTLDPRIQKTPRADVLHQSFSYGGPLALLGIFYATMDAYRNVRNRETLEFFLHKASEESKIDLMKRASAFPCNPTMAGWLHKIWEKLDFDSQSVACILQHLGTKVPKELFRRLRVPSLTWNSCGEITEVLSQVAPVIQEQPLFDAALRNLERVGFAFSTDETINLNPMIASLLQQHLDKSPWISEAVKIVVHAFPKHQNIEPAVYVYLVHYREAIYLFVLVTYHSAKFYYRNWSMSCLTPGSTRLPPSSTILPLYNWPRPVCLHRISGINPGKRLRFRLHVPLQRL